MFILFGCNRYKKEGVPISREVDNIIKIESINDNPFANINEVFKMESYAILSSDIILGNIERVIYSNEKIYILDSEDRIICYNRDGSINNVIDAKGKGPGEYLYIRDFSIDELNNSINILTNNVNVMSYSLNDGSFISNQKLKFIARNISSFEGGAFFYTPSTTSNIDKKTDIFFSLMWSENYNKIGKRYFPQDSEIASFNFTLGNPFFYNDSKLFFINQFDDIVYSLSGSGQVIPEFQLILPNAVSLSVVKQNPDLMELLQSDYSVGITDVFLCENIISFIFSHKGNYNFAFFDLEKNETIYCGSRILPIPTKELPVFHPFSGVAGEQFFSVVDPMTIIYAQEIDPDVFPSDLTLLRQTDNPVLIFYGVKK